MAEKRQVPEVNFALQHNLGLGGAVVVAIYAKGFENANVGVGRNDVGVGSNDGSVAKSSFKSSGVFDKIEQTLKSDAGENLVAKIKGVFAFKVKVTIFCCRQFCSKNSRGLFYKTLLKMKKEKIYRSIFSVTISP